MAFISVTVNEESGTAVVHFMAHPETSRVAKDWPADTTFNLAWGAMGNPWSIEAHAAWKSGKQPSADQEFLVSYALDVLAAAYSITPGDAHARAERLKAGKS